VSEINACPLCHEKQQKINQLEDEIASLKSRLKYRERKEKEGFFGSSTPSSQQPVKANTQEKPEKARGANNGHDGSGRKALALSDADHVECVEAEAGEVCPLCGNPLAFKGSDDRSVLDSRPVRAEKIIYRLEKKWCSRCHKTFRAEPPGVLPKNLYGNQLMANAAVMHYLHGMPIGRVCEQLGIGDGALLNIFHRMAKLFSGVVPRLIEQYRHDAVKHADETSWRTKGKNGYAWLFATTRISIFLFKKTRSASVPREVLGGERLAGILVVDRYGGYNKMPCAIQYVRWKTLKKDSPIKTSAFPLSLPLRHSWRWPWD
jgi:transposase